MPMTPLDRYDGPFEPGLDLFRLSRSALGRLGREYLLFGHLHDRGLMPLIASRFGAEHMTEIACDEWMGSSPVYSRRIRDVLRIPGHGVSAILKAFQFDVGFPHQYMDVRYDLRSEDLGYFWLEFCGAYEDVLAHAGGRDEPIRRICHDMEDPTFDATVMAVNPGMRCVPEHRPPLQIGHSGPVCRWRVSVGEGGDGKLAEIDITRRVRASRAGRFQHPPLPAELGEGLADYAGEFRPDLRLEDLAQPVLARQCAEIALDVHLLMRAAYAGVRDRWGDEAARALAREQWAAVAPVLVPRLRAALGIEGDDVASILKTLQVDPAFPHGYARIGCELLGEERGHFWLEECEALAEGEPDAWLALLEDREAPGFAAAVAAVNPRARCRPIEPSAVRGARGPVRLAWEIEIDPAAEPRAESPMAAAVRHSNASGFAFRQARSSATVAGPVTASGGRPQR